MLSTISIGWVSRDILLHLVEFVLLDIVHRDLKLENILLRNTPSSKTDEFDIRVIHWTSSGQSSLLLSFRSLILVWVQRKVLPVPIPSSTTTVELLCMDLLVREIRSTIRLHLDIWRLRSSRTRITVHCAMSGRWESSCFICKTRHTLFHHRWEMI